MTSQCELYITQQTPEKFHVYPNRQKRGVWCVSFSLNNVSTALKHVSLECIIQKQFVKFCVSDITTVAKGENISAESLAIDWINRNLYWTDTASDSIEMSSLNGSLRKQIVTGDLDEPRAIVVEPNDR